jgi:CNT family concentrative nucleoside transporter
MLVVFVALVYLINLFLGFLPEISGEPVTFQRLVGYVMAPIAWLMGIPMSEAVTAGGLMGIKTVLNELLAYLKFAALPQGVFSERSRLILIYAMCGFANFGSLGIMIGGLGAMAPERRDEIVGLGLKSIVAGTIHLHDRRSPSWPVPMAILYDQAAHPARPAGDFRIGCYADKFCVNTVLT